LLLPNPRLTFAVTLADSTKLRLLKEAVKRVGLQTVAAELRSPVDLVLLWSRGLAVMPDRKLLPLADLLQKFSKP
jgi:hypothetical protein